VHREGAQISVHVSGYRALLLFGAAASALQLGLSGFASSGAVRARVAAAAPGEEASAAMTLRARLRVPPRKLLAATLRAAAFWRFALLLLLCRCAHKLVDAIFLHKCIAVRTPTDASPLALYPTGPAAWCAWCCSTSPPQCQST
jgi:hypothetical protein